MTQACEKHVWGKAQTVAQQAFLRLLYHNGIALSINKTALFDCKACGN